MQIGEGNTRVISIRLGPQVLSDGFIAAAESSQTAVQTGPRTHSLTLAPGSQPQQSVGRERIVRLR